MYALPKATTTCGNNSYSFGSHLNILKNTQQNDLKLTCKIQTYPKNPAVHLITKHTNSTQTIMHKCIIIGTQTQTHKKQTLMNPKNGYKQAEKILAKSKKV